MWDCQAIKAKDTGDNKLHSKRLVVADHGHDGNVLQVTPGFQTHVATKLSAMLDSLISENSSSIQPAVYTNLPVDEDEGFRLFSTSIPGVEPEEPPPPKRPYPSSSESDSEMESRFKEAAVSISDILLPSATVLPTSPAVPDTISSETQEKVKKKKKKKWKLNAEENGLANDSQSNIVNQEDKTVKDKKKKKKKVTPGNSAQIVEKPEEPPPKAPISRNSNSEMPEILQSALPTNPAVPETGSSNTHEKVKKKKKRKLNLDENGQRDSQNTSANDNQRKIVYQDKDQMAKVKKKKKKAASGNSEVLS